ncbi:MAG TPA: hypothetical protein PKW33_06860 [Anaerolineaceae bacterium]|nr:hypothetical protein [Anaerolineaceae bacterium]HPN51289.1 hypothetical protein [Anaerolineaceae bacterium]
MWRNRRSPRGRGGLMGRMLDPFQQPPILKEAHALYDHGRFNEAAGLFEKLAAGARQRMGRQAPFLFIMAGMARVQAGQPAVGISYLNEGMQILAAASRWRAFWQTGQRCVAELNQAGYPAEAQQVEAWLQNARPPQAAQMPAPAAPGRPALPLKCPFCGGGVDPSAVDWLDEQTAECDYCGSPIRSEA